MSYRAAARLGVCILALTVIAPAVHAQAKRATKATNIAGTWIGTTEVPNVGPDEITLVLKKAKTGYAGTIADAKAVIAPATELKDVSFADGVLSCSFSLADGATVSMKVKAEGGKLTGSWTHEQGDTGPITFEKKKA